MKLLLRSIVFLCVAAFSPLVSGQTFWQFTQNGDFNNPSNWSNGVPNTTTSGTGIIEPVLGLTYTVTLSTGGTIQSISGLGVEGSGVIDVLGNTGGIVDLNLSTGSTLNVVGSIPSGSGNADIFVDFGGTLNFNGGTLDLQQGTVNVGDTSGSGSLVFTGATFNYDFQTTGNFTSVEVGTGLNAVGSVTENSSSVIMGNELFIGTGGGKGNYILQNNSTLSTGTMITTPAAPGDFDYYIVIGSNNGLAQGSSGTLTILDSSTLTAGPNSAILLGTVDTILGSSLPVGTTGGTGTIVQNGALSNIVLNGALFAIGAYNGGTGEYDLMAGTLTANGAEVDVAPAPGSTGKIQQTGGAMMFGTDSIFTVGEGGAGTYLFSGGTADFQNGFVIGGTGTLTQSGTSVLTTENTGSLIAAGGFYNMNGGAATFSSTLTVDGTLSINGGTLSIAPGSLGGGGALDFGGGTLKFTPDATTTFTDNFSGGVLAPGTVSTIDASAAPGLANVVFANPLSGGGGISFIGNGNGTSIITGTTFSFLGTNSYTGPTSITNGVLDISGDDIAGSSALNINNTGAVTTTAANLTLTAALPFAGSLGGNGTLNVTFDAAGDPMVILNASSFTGAINLTSVGVNKGTLQVYNGTFGAIGDGGTGSNVTIGGAPVPPAAFPFGTNIPSTGVVNFTGANTYTGLTTVNSGFTLNALNLAGAATVGSVLSPGGTLNVTGLGAAGGITGSASNVINNGGTVTVASTLGIGGSVMNSGTLFALKAGSLANPGVTNTGTLGLYQGSAIGSTFAITGPLNSNVPNPTPAIIDIRFNGNTADNFTVASAANSTLSGVINVIGSGSITDVPIVTTTGGGIIKIGGDTILNDPGGLETSAPTGILFSASLQLADANTELQLTTVQIGIVQAVSEGKIPALTYNQNQVALAIDSPLIGGSLPFGSLLNNIANINPAAVPALLDQLSPETLQYARIIAFENSNFLAERMNGVCADLRNGYAGLDSSAISVVSPAFNTGLGRSLGSLLAADPPAYHPSAPNGVNYYPGGSGGGEEEGASPSSSSSTQSWDSSSQVISDSPNPYMTTQNPAGPETPRLSEFIGGDAVLADLNQNQTATNAAPDKASYVSGDATAGVSFRMTSHLALGVLFDYNHTDATTDSNNSKTKVDSYSPGFFATYFDHGFYVNGLFSFGFNQYSNTRDIGFLDETASSHPNGEQYVGDLDFGYDFHPDKTWVIGPTLGGTYTHLNIDSFSESGANEADLNVDSQSADSLRSRLGGHVIMQTNTGNVLLQPNLSVMWQHEFLDNGSGITSSFNDFSSSDFTIQTASPARDSALIAVGMTATLNNSMALYLSYMADVGATDYFAQSVVGGFKARF